MSEHAPQAVEPALRPIDKAYFEATAKQELPPIVVESPRGGKVNFVGTKHTNNPEDPFFGRLGAQWQQFASDNSRPKVVVLEGWRPGYAQQGESVDEAVAARGENAFIEQRALEAGIEIKSYEPAPHEEFEQLAQRFDPQQVFYWLVARQATQWAREDAVPRKLPWNKEKRTQRSERVLTQHLASYVERLEGALGHVPSFNEVGRSFEALAETHRELFGSEIDWNDTKHFYRQANPAESHSVINDIHRASNQLRDETVFEGIKADVQAGKNVLALYGDAHAWALQDKLRSLAGE